MNDPAGRDVDAAASFSWALLTALLVVLLLIGVFHRVEVTPVALACLLLWWAGPRLIRRGIEVLVVAVALILAVLILTPALRPVQAWLDVGRSPAHADVVIVLGGGLNCHTGEIGSTTTMRLMRGAELVSRGYAPTLVLSHTPPLVGGVPCPSIADRMTAVLEGVLGKQQLSIAYLPDVRTTHDEATRASAAAHEYGWKRVLLVTSPFHSRRATATFARAGVNVIPVTSAEPEYDVTLSAPSDRFQAIRPLVHELGGILVYALRGWL